MTIFRKKLLIIVFLFVSLSCFAQQQHLVVEKIENEKKVVIRTGDKARVYFISDTVLRRKYRPRAYKKKDKRVSYAMGKIVRFTDEGFLLKVAQNYPASFFKKNKDTLSIKIDNILAINKYRSGASISTSVFSRLLIRGGVLTTSFLIDIPDYVFFGMNFGSFYLEPYMRRLIQGTVMPLKKVQGDKARWKLYFEYDPGKNEKHDMTIPIMGNN